MKEASSCPRLVWIRVITTKALGLQSQIREELIDSRLDTCGILTPCGSEVRLTATTTLDMLGSRA